ncbi:DUF6168 family protein [Psychroserpens jangbogonensis]|uniref:DUF6168 family protein n=1 Tax=Psychroserpens jangbogonensis TaxID=1484460 RepID=UPI00053E58EE|nr:DUF6168 family protein [Psychroserpens jangbogonensis]
MKHTFTLFSLKLIIVLAAAFAIHLFILSVNSLPLFDDKIVLAYIVNAVLAITIFGFLFKMKEKYKDQLGFLFLGGSLLKFLVFFIVFYPFYKIDGNISKLEFAAFFVPYLLSLVLETFSLAKWLNKME